MMAVPNLTISEQRLMDIYQEAVHSVVAAYERARATGRRNMNAMSLATVSGDGRPSVRTVLLKHVDESGLIFFTDARSRKGRDLAANKAASICMYWEPIEEQVRVDGYVESVSTQTVADDFAARPRAGQVMLWASTQSHALDSMESLRARMSELETTLADPAPIPPDWTGYRLVPDYIETWRGSRDRLHERIAYQQRMDGWQKQWLQP